MGIEYDHYFLVRDLSWRPSKEAAERAHQFLVGEGLVSEKPVLHTMKDRRSKKITGKSVENAGAIPDELLMEYPPQYEGNPGAEILGPCCYCGNGEFEGFVVQVELLFGRDFKLLTSLDMGPVSSEVDAPGPHREGWWSFDAYPAEWSDQPPTATCDARNALTGAPMDVPEGFSPVFRSGVRLACGKSHPMSVQENPFAGLPSKTFVKGLETALGTTVAEVGLYS